MIELEKIKITDLIPSDYNPRIMPENEATKLKNSLETFGLVDPIVINLKNNHIIGGHQRFDVLIDQHLEDNKIFDELNLIRLGDIGWVFTDTDLTVESEDHEKALNLSLNKISGEWDTEKLFVILEELEVNDFDLGLTGFDGFDEEVELKGLLDKMEFREPNSKNSHENSENETGDDDFEDEDNTGLGFYEITLLFDSEEEMTEAFDKLVDEGYNCRMSDS
ncbi:MAG: hypothetical protein IJF83_03610 [Methanobrevibacter sp.]|nr:hypothetical protein [Methanobrevibacter sp.]